jgi:hypothetical protein
MSTTKEQPITASQNPATIYLDRVFEKRFGPLEGSVRESLAQTKATGEAVLHAVREAVSLMASVKAMQQVYERRTQVLEDDVGNLKAIVSTLSERMVEMERRISELPPPVST